MISIYFLYMFGIKFVSDLFFLYLLKAVYMWFVHISDFLCEGKNAKIGSLLYHNAVLQADHATAILLHESVLFTLEDMYF